MLFTESSCVEENKPVEFIPERLLMPLVLYKTPTLKIKIYNRDKVMRRIDNFYNEIYNYK